MPGKRIQIKTKLIREFPMIDDDRLKIKVEDVVNREDRPEFRVQYEGTWLLDKS